MTINFEWIIQNFPTLVMLILPGYIFLVCYKFCEAGKRGGIKTISIESLIASYIITVLYTGLRSLIGGLCNKLDAELTCIRGLTNLARQLAHNDILNTIVLITLSAVIGTIVGHKISKQSTKEFIEKHLQVSLYSNPWLEIPNGKEGDYVDIHIKDGKTCYRGTFKTHFDYNGETWLVITDYIQVNPYTKEKCELAGCNIADKKQYKQPPQILINIKDIVQVEFLGIEK